MDHEVEDGKYLELWRAAETPAPPVANDPQQFPEECRGIIEVEE